MRFETLEDAVFYSQSVYLRVMIVVRVRLACIALVMLAVLHANRKKFVAHPSLTVLLDFHFFWVFLMCVSVIAEYSHLVFILAVKYQITENVRMIRIMLPVVWSHVLITTAAIIIFFIVTYIMGLSPRYFPLFEDSINLVFLQGICMPMLDARRAKAVMETNTATVEELKA
ncbi:hypothetical protein PRIPAC_97627, partial [Pristionchus pacificus]|uniref:Uncharacterized protein n=1 Tax=Pristionchus pacificus TaxID=54126 RepID=A0A2A6B3E7_PRIPA